MLSAHREYVARNNARESQNRIHSDDVARQYGFDGALVPGTTLYAYACGPVMELLGDDWLRRGTMSMGFSAPVYEGETIRAVAFQTDDPLNVEVRVEGPEGKARAGAAAASTPTCGDFPERAVFPVAQPPPRPVPMTEDALLDIPWLGTITVSPTRSLVQDYLAGIGVTEDPAGDAGVIHPAYLVRTYTEIMAGTFERLGPSIHTASRVRHRRAASFGETLSLRGRVDRLFGRKGHRFLVLDLVLYDEGEHAAMQIEHSAIYRPRPAGVSPG